MEVAMTQGSSVKALLHDHYEQTGAWIAAQIMRTCQYLECKNTITNTDDAMELALEIVERNSNLKIEEYPTVFKNIRMQRYGKYYERLKAGEFLEAFHAYDTSEERLNVHTISNTKHNKELPEPLKNVDYSKWGYEPQKKKISDNFSPEEKLKRQRAMAAHILQTPKEQNDLDAENHEPTGL